MISWTSWDYSIAYIMEQTTLLSWKHKTIYIVCLFSHRNHPNKSRQKRNYKIPQKAFGEFIFFVPNEEHRANFQRYRLFFDVFSVMAFLALLMDFTCNKAKFYRHNFHIAHTCMIAKEQINLIMRKLDFALCYQHTLR